VQLIEPGRYRVRAKIIDPRSGKPKEVDKLIEAASAKEAAAQRSALIEEVQEAAVPGQRMRVGDYARLWLDTKTPTLDQATAERYAESLEQHVLPEIGNLFLDALRPADIQAWVNGKLKERHGKGKKHYAADTVRGWFRVLRTMVRDAVSQLDLPRDPTARVTFPDAASAITPEAEDANALSPEELAVFLAAMRSKYPQHYALAATLAFTGLRFCHASALRWEDLDEAEAVIHIHRKNIRGRVGPVSRKKRAPKELPLVAELAAILKEHRQTLLRDQAPGFDSGWMFPSRIGELRAPSTMAKAWEECLEAAGVAKRFTPHGLRRTFNDLNRRAGVDAIVTRAMTGHVTERMREHYSSVGLDEKRKAVADVVRLVPTKVGTEVGTEAGKKKAG
jgi:integrase